MPPDSLWRADEAVRGRRHILFTGMLRSYTLAEQEGPAPYQCDHLRFHPDSPSWMLYWQRLPAATGSKSLVTFLHCDAAGSARAALNWRGVMAVEANAALSSLDWRRDQLVVADLLGRIRLHRVPPPATADQPVVSDAGATITPHGQQQLVSSAVRLHPHDRERLAVVTGSAVQVYSVATSPAVLFQQQSTRQLHAAEFHPTMGGAPLLLGGESRSLHVVDWARGNIDGLRVTATHAAAVRSVHWHPVVPEWFLSLADDGVHLWDIRRPHAGPLARLLRHRAAPMSVALSPAHAELLASGGGDRALLLSNLRQPPHYELCNSLDTFQSAVATVAWPHPNRIVGVSEEGEVRLVDLQDSFLAPLIPHRRPLTTAGTVAPRTLSLDPGGGGVVPAAELNDSFTQIPVGLLTQATQSALQACLQPGQALRRDSLAVAELTWAVEHHRYFGQSYTALLIACDAAQLCLERERPVEALDLLEIVLPDPMAAAPAGGVADTAGRSLSTSIEDSKQQHQAPEAAATVLRTIFEDLLTPRPITDPDCAALVTRVKRLRFQLQVQRLVQQQRQLGGSGDDALGELAVLVTSGAEAQAYAREAQWPHLTATLTALATSSSARCQAAACGFAGNHLIKAIGDDLLPTPERARRYLWLATTLLAPLLPLPEEDTDEKTKARDPSKSPAKPSSLTPVSLKLQLHHRATLWQGPFDAEALLQHLLPPESVPVFSVPVLEAVLASVANSAAPWRAFPISVPLTARARAFPPLLTLITQTLPAAALAALNKLEHRVLQGTHDEASMKVLGEGLVACVEAGETGGPDATPMDKLIEAWTRGTMSLRSVEERKAVRLALEHQLGSRHKGQFRPLLSAVAAAGK